MSQIVEIPSKVYQHIYDDIEQQGVYRIGLLDNVIGSFT